MDQEHALGLEAIRDIRSMMARSSRFVSLSGWSGIWAGGAGLLAAYIAHRMIVSGGAHPGGHPAVNQYYATQPENLMLRLLMLAAVTILVAGAGACFFTFSKARKQNLKVWGSASKKLFISVLIPMLAGGVFCLSFLQNGYESYIAPACLAFYGMALVSGGKYTLGEIRYLGYSELLLGCICLFFPGYGLEFWAIGFGVMHIIYGIIMWNKYDKKLSA